MTWLQIAALVFVSVISLVYCYWLLRPRERPIDVVMARARAKRAEQWKRKRDGG